MFSSIISPIVCTGPVRCTYNFCLPYHKFVLISIPSPFFPRHCKHPNLNIIPHVTFYFTPTLKHPPASQLPNPSNFTETISLTPQASHSVFHHIFLEQHSDWLSNRSTQEPSTSPPQGSSPTHSLTHLFTK
jgi:hypothetical protein